MVSPIGVSYTGVSYSAALVTADLTAFVTAVPNPNPNAHETARDHCKREQVARVGDGPLDATFTLDEQTATRAHDSPTSEDISDNDVCARGVLVGVAPIEIRKMGK